MEELAKELRIGIDIICGTFHFRKNEDVLLEARALSENIERFCSSFLQGNIYGMEEQEYQEFHAYVVSVLKDYVEAVNQQDAVYMLDTLDHGLRELVNLYAEENEGEDSGEAGDE